MQLPAVTGTQKYGRCWESSWLLMTLQVGARCLKHHCLLYSAGPLDGVDWRNFHDSCNIKGCLLNLQLRHTSTTILDCDHLGPNLRFCRHRQPHCDVTLFVRTHCRPTVPTPSHDAPLAVSTGAVLNTALPPSIIASECTYC